AEGDGVGERDGLGDAVGDALGVGLVATEVGVDVGMGSTRSLNRGPRDVSLLPSGSILLRENDDRAKSISPLWLSFPTWLVTSIDTHVCARTGPEVAIAGRGAVLQVTELSSHDSPAT
ncbi:MAG: hypothetical protein M3290_11260, partial [Actinomycetota bacterium]|nr:hypothetical protein [Actinomycetota bacterium]